MASSSQEDLQVFADSVVNSAAGTVAKVGEAIGGAGRVDESTNVRRRWGEVVGFDATANTVDVRLDGVIVPAMPHTSWYQPTIGDTVIVSLAGSDPVCLGPVGESTGNQFLVYGASQNSRGLPPSTLPWIQFNTADLTGKILLTGDYLYASAINVDLTGNQLGVVTQTIYGVGSADNETALPANGQTQSIMFRNHAHSTTLRVSNAGLQSGFVGLQFPNSTGSYFDLAMPKDSVGFVNSVYNGTVKRWQLTAFGAGVQYPGSPSRPVISYSHCFSGVNPSTSQGYNLNASYRTILFQCVRNGTAADLLPPTGGGGTATWQLLGGVGLTNGVYCGVWTKIVTSGSVTITTNLARGLPSLSYVFMTSGNLAPIADDLLTGTFPTSSLVHTCLPLRSPSYDSLLIGVWTLGPSCNLSSTSGAVTNNLSTPTAGLINPSTYGASDGTNSLTAIGVSRWADTPTDVPAISVNTDVATAGTYAAFFLRPNTT